MDDEENEEEEKDGDKEETPSLVPSLHYNPIE